MWHAHAIAEVASAALRAEEDRRVAEQAVHGVESLDEAAVHALLADAYTHAGYGVVREQPYPAEWKRKRGRRSELPGQADRARCDIVLLPSAGDALADALQAERTEVRRKAEARDTLFESSDEAEPRPPQTGVAPDEAYWLECKVVGQFCYRGGVPGPNGTYASEVLRGVAGDLRKLRGDPAILHGGVLLVLFTASEAVADADLGILIHRMLDKEILVRAPESASFAIQERIGNTHCRCAVIEPMRSG